MTRFNWKKCAAVITTIALLDALVGPMGNPARAAGGILPEPKSVSSLVTPQEETQPEIVTPSANGTFISVFFSKSLTTTGSYQGDDFVVTVNGAENKVTSVAPLIDPDNLITFAFLFLEQPVLKGDAITVQYINEANPLTDAEGNPLSTSVVNVKNSTRGAFAAPPVINLPSQAGYRLKAGNPILTFSPTSGNANRIQFTFPNEELNPPWLESNDSLHTKSDYVILNNTDHKVYAPRVMFLNPGLSMVDFILAPGDFMEEGKSYTLAMSSTASGKEVRLPVHATTHASAWVTLFRDTEDDFSVIDEYQFQNLVLNVVPNVPPTPVTGVEAVLARGGDPIVYSPSDLATDDDEDDLTLSSPDTDDEDIAIAEVIQNQLHVQPVGVGSTNVYVDVSDGNGHMVTVTVKVEVRKAQTPAISVGDVESLLYEDRTYSLTIANVPGSAVVKVYDSETNGQLLSSKTQLGNQGPLTLRVNGGVDGARVYVTLTDTAADKTESAPTRVNLPEVEYKSSLKDAITEAQTLHDNAVEGAEPGQYPVGSKAILQAAIQAAIAVRDDADATLEQVEDAEDALYEAIHTFEESSYQVLRTALSKEITAAQALHDKATEGTGGGQYPIGSKAILLAAINTAKIVQNNVEAMPSQITNAITALKNAEAAFAAGQVKVDKAALQTALQKAQQLHDNATEGTSPGQYATGSKAILQAAIEAAQAVYDAPLATQNQLNQAETTLNTAIADFEKTKVPNGNGGGGGGGGNDGGGNGGTGGNGGNTGGDPGSVVHAPYISGYPGGLFKPDDSITRAEIASLIARAFSDKEGNKNTSFTDVSDSQWSAQAIHFVASRGIMNGYPDGTFHPDQAITRAEMAVLLTALLQAGTTGHGNGFADTKGHWAEAAILRAQAAGAISGYPDGTFRPEQALSRAEAVVLINKLLDRKPLETEAPLFVDVPKTHWAFGAIQAASK